MAEDHALAPAPVLTRGSYVARFVVSEADLERAFALRHRCFIDQAGRPARAGGLESDRFDALCDHALVEDAEGRAVCTFRVMGFGSGAALATSYSAAHYDLSRLAQFEAPMVELGRFCVAPDVVDPDVVRLAWGLLACFVDRLGAQMLFGCSSFAGTDPARYGAAFDVLSARHLAPAAWAPGVGSGSVIRFGDKARAVVDRRAGLAQLPTLLRTYLSMGGWVGDHAVIDREMNTLHVFTGLEIAAIPAARARALRAVAG